MSSELIGELGQVGLTIGEPRSNLQDEDSKSLDDTLSDDSPHHHDRKRTRYSTLKPKKFRSEWMNFDIFKDWLRPHTRPELATCIVCSRVIKAGKSELEKHATGKRHLKMLEMHTQGADKLQEDGGQELDVFTLNDSRSLTGEESFPGFTKIDSAQYKISIESVSAVEGSIDSLTPALRNSMDNVTEESFSSKAVVTKSAPHWKATAIINGHVTKLDLTSYRGRYVILVFYCNDFSKICSSEINALSDRLGEFRSLKTEIVACSTDSHLAHLVWVKTPRSDGGVANPKIPLLADPSHTIAKDYGVYLSDKGHALRAHFIIDRKGILRHMAVNDTFMGRGTDELLRLLCACQYVDETEEPLAADWSPNTQLLEDTPKTFITDTIP